MMWTTQILVGVLLIKAAFCFNMIQRSPAKDKDPSYPFMVSIQHHGKHKCGGSIIHPSWVLTAAHCVVGYNTFDFHVIYGVKRLSNPSGSPNVGLKRIIPHEGYREKNLYNDIALLELSRILQFSDILSAVKLPHPYYNIEQFEISVPALLINWGPWQELNKSLQKKDMKIYADAKCKQRHGITADQMCGDGDCGIGLCSGDTGDPLLLNGTQIGIASSHDGIFTKVSRYIVWIKKNI